MKATELVPAPGAAQRTRVSSDPGARTAPRGWPDTIRGKPTPSMIGLLLVEMIIGYEWFISGFDKFFQGGFPAGLAAALQEKTAKTPEWYGAFLKSAVIPNARIFGYAVEASELLAGIALIAGPLIWLLAWDRVSDRTRRTVLFFTAVAAIGGAFLAVNLHFANGASHPWLIPGAAFDEGIDLDIVLPAIQIVIATVSIVLFRRLGRIRADGTPSPQSR